MTNEWKRSLSLTTLVTQTAGWMASCASSTLPKSMPLATSDPCMPIPGLAKEPPAPDPTKTIPASDPFGDACD
eukprot:626039-Pyramimonas_sp.AAC.1